MNILLTIAILFLSYVFYSGYNKFKRFNKNQLNGPTPLPVLGNLLQLTESPHIKATELHDVYGDIYRLWFGDVYTVIVRDPTLIREMFVTNSHLFMNRPIVPTFTFGTGYFGISTSRDESWTNTRDLVSKAIKKSSLKRIYDILDVQVDELIKSMKGFEKTGQPFEIHLYAQRFTLAIMFKYIFNEDVSYDEDILTGKIMEMSVPMDEIIKDCSSGKLGDYITAIDPLYLQWLKLTNTSFGKVKKFVAQRYEEHLKTIDKENPRDLLDLLINEYSTLDKESVEHICATCFDMFIAGNDTTANTINWFVLRMQENYDIQDKVYAELKSIIEKDPTKSSILLSDRPNTPFLNSLIKESLRFNPVSPFALPRVVSEDIIIGNGKYFIPKDSQVLVNYKALSLNEKYFKNANVYDPTRFLGANSSNDGYIPFGIGPRNCVGQTLALDEVFLAFSNILLNFKIKNAGVKVDDSEIFGLTLKPHKFNVLLESRN